MKNNLIELQLRQIYWNCKLLKKFLGIYNF